MTPRITAILPCRGRPEQTARNVGRLLATAGLVYGEAWELRLLGGADEGAMLAQIASETAGATGHSIIIGTSAAPRLTYWQAMALGTLDSQAPLICNLANDLLPGQHWLRRGLDAYEAVFGPNDGLLGFNDGHHLLEHSCHFLVSRTLLASLGGWPVWYDHNYGDTELCRRTAELDAYAKAPWAVLYHDHPYFGGADDATYAEGRAQAMRDGQLFNERRRAGWPRVV